jgi:addiction module HigA family antidote
MKKNLLPLTTPGEILNEEFLIPLGISQYRLAKDIGISSRRINEIVHGQRAITPNTALRLGKYFGVSAQFWLNLQARFALQTAERSSDFLSSIRPYNNTTALAA